MTTAGWWTRSRRTCRGWVGRRAGTGLRTRVCVCVGGVGACLREGWWTVSAQVPDGVWPGHATAEVSPDHTHRKPPSRCCALKHTSRPHPHSLRLLYQYAYNSRFFVINHECNPHLPPRQELDFRHEAANSERCRANLEASAKAGAWHADRCVASSVLRPCDHAARAAERPQFEPESGPGRGVCVVVRPWWIAGKSWCSALGVRRLGSSHVGLCGTCCRCRCAVAHTTTPFAGCTCRLWTTAPARRAFSPWSLSTA